MNDAIFGIVHFYSVSKGWPWNSLFTQRRKINFLFENYYIFPTNFFPQVKQYTKLESNENILLIFSVHSIYESTLTESQTTLIYSNCTRRIAPLI